MKSWKLGGATQIARFLREAEVIGTCPRCSKSAYSFNQTDTVYRWKGVLVVVGEVAHNRFVAAEVDPSAVTVDVIESC